MEYIAKFKVGSRYFFDEYPDYIIKDSDVLFIYPKSNPPTNEDKLAIAHKFIDGLYFPEMTKEEYLEFGKKPKMSFQIGMFLIPEFCNFAGITIEDLKTLKESFYSIDALHSYETLIFGFYVENNAFFLTEEQRNAAYEEYKTKRSAYSKPRSKYQKVRQFVKGRINTIKESGECKPPLRELQKVLDYIDSIQWQDESVIKGRITPETYVVIEKCKKFFNENSREYKELVKLSSIR